MDSTLSGITRALSRDVEALDVVSQNISNMRTPGYRAEHITQDFAQRVAQARLQLDLSDGAIEQTGRQLDVALQGNGFFMVDAGGQSLLSRDGQLQVDANGILTDAAGHPVLGESGPIQTDGNPISIRSNGEIVQAGHVIDRIRMVGIGQPERLQGVGNGLYAYDGEIVDWNGMIHAGALEAANVKPGEEMIRLMQVTRHAQTLQHAAQAYDQVLQTGISQLGKQG
ncbi:flagellar basal-body rod protein FlgF [Oleiagrimonas citrea]|uniref:Flagellar hook basal-body protein n=1 Tax=Oleiagrimonas citrea TaxID=1665687 RepID=A0A846ZLE0_9GAMM|nr:flagellar hook basal-body protein [Oleiagrimonas citrea]NKZ39014.1 flagellar hook basal-body protein [Oleiagrimonas citrea]